MTAWNFESRSAFATNTAPSFPSHFAYRRAAMEDLHESLAGLRGLYQDLSVASDGGLEAIDRLCMELETHIEDFRKLLDRPAKNNTSRQSVVSGKITICDVEYSVNQDFQQGALQVADALGIDELEAAKLFLAAQEDSQVLDRPARITAIMRFHERRHFLLESLRLILRGAADDDEDEETETQIRAILSEAMSLILDIKGGQLRNASLFARKVLDAMADTEKWLSLLNDQAQKVTVVGVEDADNVEAIEHLSHSLQEQHESLGAILFYLFRSSWLSSEDFRLLVAQLKKLERVDGLLVHYLPGIIASINRYGSPAGNPGSSRTEARSLHTLITTSQDGQSWKLPDFHAVIIAVWLSAYSSWYFEDDSTNPTSRGDPETEAKSNTTTFMGALNDGALDFMLAICSSVNSEEWADPARSSLVELLLKEKVLPESWNCNPYMKQLLMENFGVFVESCIENMPDAIRLLKSEEDTQRLNQLTAMRDGLTSGPSRGPIEVRTHLESFLVIISFAFEHRPQAALSFWEDPDANLYGFLQWASKRQTVPRVGAFCEMLCSISEGEENASAAHRFLSEEDKFISSKLKRTTTMSWAQMFAEVQLYCSRLTEKPSTGNVHQGLRTTRKPEPVDMNEPESAVMLTCYLRLMGHLCKQSKTVRDWMWQNTSFPVINSLLDLCTESTPNHVRATVFATLSALLTDKTTINGNTMWFALDQWVSGASLKPTEAGKVPLVSNPPKWYEKQTLDRIGLSIDQTNAFVILVKSLVDPASDLMEFPLALPFPEYLGRAHRTTGIEPYIDFVLGHAFPRKFDDQPGYQSRFLTFHCLDFIVMCLRSFNEDLVTFLCEPTGGLDPGVTLTAITSYVQHHPFARVMEWLFNEDVLRTLFSISSQDVTRVAQASSDSVLVLTLLRCLETMELAINLQATYLYIAKPLLERHIGPRNLVANSWLGSFEDAVLNNLRLVPALCLYCGTGHQQLTVTSMALLEKLTSSPKLNKMSSPGITKWQSSNKIVEVLASDVDVDSVTRALVTQMQPDPRELEWGSESAGYVIRESLLALLNQCLGMITDRPTVAHLLLGFKCVGNVLDVESDGSFANAMSMLHAVIGFLQTYPTEIHGSITSWTIHLKRMALETLSHLWSSRLASHFTLAEMRTQGFLVGVFANQPLVGPGTAWDGVPVASEEFWCSNAASAMAEFLLFRSHLFAYATTEVRAAAKVGSSTLQTETLSILLGNAILENGDPISTASVFDLFDFADLPMEREFTLPRLDYFKEFSDRIFDLKDDKAPGFTVADTEQLIRVRKTELLDTGNLRDEEAFNAEVTTLRLVIEATHRARRIQNNRFLALRSWTELITTILACSVLDDASRPTFILHAIQLILSKLDAAITDDSPEAFELARLAETLISRLTFDLSTTPASRSGDVIDEKLHQLFQVSARGIVLFSDSVPLREMLYTICSHYITRITSSDSAQDTTHDNLRTQSQRLIKAAGAGLVDKVCDDAYGSQDTCRAAALLMLNCLAVLDSRTDCILAGIISRSNFLSLFLDAIRSLPVELQNAEAADTPILLDYYESLLALLQQLSQTKNGATFVLQSGLFESVRDSHLFAIDPDVGIEIDNTDALKKYYDLLLCMIRVIVSAVFSRGVHNEQIKLQTRAFLAEHRSCMVGVFKRFAQIGGTTSPAHREALCELVKSFMALLTATDYLEFEEAEAQQTGLPPLFS
ncbi:hypothetical protein N7492_010570 [Penicillium capsulatum]|uniref:Nuclear pore complex subunit Nup192 n=1 Tax=Penicillium capsulatum TaxID=69766 RepID=A0A9W9HPE4_9EURO|nr:hypothetical protein N7492_010570 [Penicillium capsulatum]KAJ6113070.1 hypothetical protein N7512_008394 [Penicillium capsulatum]